MFLPVQNLLGIENDTEMHNKTRNIKFIHDDHELNELLADNKSELTIPELSISEEDIKTLFQDVNIDKPSTYTELQKLITQGVIKCLPMGKPKNDDLDPQARHNIQENCVQNTELSDTQVVPAIDPKDEVCQINI